MTVSLPSPPLLAVATGIVGSAWMSGAIAACSLIGTSAALAVPETAAQSWSAIYARGANLMPKVAVTTTLVYGYASYAAYQASENWEGYATAAACVVAIVPWTIFAMADINGKLHKVAATGTGDKANVAALIQKWDKFNLTRSLLTFTGTVVAFATFLSNRV